MEKKVVYTYRSKHVQAPPPPPEVEEKEFESIQQYLDSLNRKKTGKN